MVTVLFKMTRSLFACSDRRWAPGWCNRARQCVGSVMAVGRSFLPAAGQKIMHLGGGHLLAGVHFSLDVLPMGADQGSCAHKCVS